MQRIDGGLDPIRNSVLVKRLLGEFLLGLAPTLAEIGFEVAALFTDAFPL